MACNSFATRILPIFCVIKSNKITLSSPRSWGCFLRIAAAHEGQPVFPTLVGVFLSRWRHPPPERRLPHARGGVSQDSRQPLRFHASSPRSWGCFCSHCRSPILHRVFPTLVGVFPDKNLKPKLRSGLPHARGGVSFYWSAAHDPLWSSPRSWGCFPGRGRAAEICAVFPTLVGVFPS